jgi:surface polysaccharide O-acyltransferase-like enzyme
VSKMQVNIVVMILMIRMTMMMRMTNKMKNDNDERDGNCYVYFGLIFLIIICVRRLVVMAYKHSFEETTLKVK